MMPKVCIHFAQLLLLTASKETLLLSLIPTLYKLIKIKQIPNIKLKK